MRVSPAPQIVGIQAKVKRFIRPPETKESVQAAKPKTAQAKLAKALEDDNQGFINGEQHEQQMLMRCASSSGETLAVSLAFLRFRHSPLRRGSRIGRISVLSGSQTPPNLTAPDTPD
jgi:hypothetical protein